jgi:iron complex transport system ATP-binding protein
VILEAQQLRFSYGTLPVLQGIDMTIRPGITAILGPNAAGKSTLFRCLSGLLRPSGEIRLDHRDIQSFSPDERTQAVSYLPQNIFSHAVLTVFEAVLLGRAHKLGWHVSNEDAELVESLLADFGIADLSGRYITELSGGQAQLVSIAQALARQPMVLLLDEPNTSLDLQHQFEICGRIRAMTLARGLSTAISVHDINMAARIADVVYIMERGQIRCSGTPREVLTREMIRSVYGVEAQVTHDPEGRPFITPMGLVKKEA